MPPADDRGHPVAISDLAQSQPDLVRKGPECAVCEALAELPPAEAAGLESLLANKRWRYKEIAAKIAEDPDSPLEIHHGTYARHAKGECWAMRKAGRRLR